MVRERKRERETELVLQGNDNIIISTTINRRQVQLNS